MRPIECRGDHREMGVAQGAACRDTLKHLDQALVELAEVPLEAGLPRLARGASRWLLPAASKLARRALAADLTRHYPRQLDRLAGIARGAGVAADWLYVGPAVELALSRVSYTTPACTAIGVTGGRSRGGEPMIVKNFDYPDAARDTYIVRTSRPTRRGLAASVDVSAAPMAGSHEGVNEHGLAVAYNYGYFRGKPAARVPITHLVQELLELCRTVDDAIEHLRRRPRAGAALLMLADARGGLAVVEVAPDLIEVTTGEALVCANHGLTRPMQRRDVPRDAVLGRLAPRDVRGRRVHASSEARWSRAWQLLDQLGAAAEPELVAIARDHGDASEPSDDTVCRHGPYWRTTCSVVLFPQRRTMKVVMAAPCEADYQVISL